MKGTGTRAQGLRVDRGHLKLLAWIACSTALVLSLYMDHVVSLISGLNTLLLSTLGTAFPAYPFLVLLVVLTAFRARDFHHVALVDEGLFSRPLTRAAGVLLALSPLAFWSLPLMSGPDAVYVSMELSAVTIVLVAYGVLLALIPAMARIMLPYAFLYVVGLVSPLVMIDYLGGPLIGFSSLLTAAMVGATGIHVSWQGAAFQLVAANGGQISAVISPPCSAAYSISIFLALLGLMYLDLRKSVGLTSKLAILGVVALPILNSARIALTILAGYFWGPSSFWTVHDWLGYSMFLGFYIVVLVVYARGPGRASGPGVTTALVKPR